MCRLVRIKVCIIQITGNVIREKLHVLYFYAYNYTYIRYFTKTVISTICLFGFYGISADSIPL